jgi:hypothetical protein
MKFACRQSRKNAVCCVFKEFIWIYLMLLGVLKRMWGIVRGTGLTTKNKKDLKYG